VSRRLFSGALLLLAPGCAFFRPAGGSDKPDDGAAATRRVTVQFHLAGQAAAGRVHVPAPGGGAVYVDAQPLLTRSDVAAARAFHGSGASFVEIVFNFEGRFKLAELTRTHAGQRLAILIDGALHSAPRIAGEVSGGRAFISNLSRADAESVAASLSR
jgi:preprotein translocase subunit SecD